VPNIHAVGGHHDWLIHQVIPSMPSPWLDGTGTILNSIIHPRLSTWRKGDSMTFCWICVGWETLGFFFASFLTLLFYTAHLSGPALLFNAWRSGGLME